VSHPYITFVFFLYGLAFFSMGLVVALEYSRASDARLRHALRPLAAFGLIHALHEWLEMFQVLELLPWQAEVHLLWDSIRLAILAFSFLSLGAFGASLLAPNERLRRISLLFPLALVSVWGLGLLIMRGQYPLEAGLWDVADAWTRYVLGIPGALAASAGLVAQQRAFRQAGLITFGRDSLWAAVAFAWYGIIGQVFPHASALPPSNVINQDTFLQVFGFPIQVVRAGAAVGAAIFVIRFLRSFEVETQRKITELQAARLEEAERREALRGELLRRVVAAQEAERQRIARELHDETGQALTALGLGLRAVRSRLRQDEDQAERNVRQLEGMAAHSLDELHHLIADLRPSHLDDLGLASTLRWYAKDLQSRAPLDIRVEISGEQRPLSATRTTALFRVAQEALTNVIKHSGAEHAQVRLHFNEREITLEVEDNGHGFEVSAQAIPSRPSWGLLGMQERAALLGGRFDIHSNPGHGTCVRVSIPYEGLEEAE
jgi:signal transduction histidine kinase